jgi:hypothetical protein
MKKLLLTTSFLALLCSASAAETRTEIITEEVCHAIAGCWVDTTTGECPDCVMETRKIVVETIMPTIKKVALEVPSSYYNYGYPTLAGMNILTTPFIHN